MQESLNRLKIAAIAILSSAALSIIAIEAKSANSSYSDSDAPSLRSTAVQHYLSGDSDTALDYYQKAVRAATSEYGRDSSYIGQLYYEMGNIEFDDKNFVKASVFLQKAVEQNPNSVMARVKLAQALQIRGKNSDALQQINAALAKHRGSPEARQALVLWLQQNGQKANAIHESYLLSVAAQHSNEPPTFLVAPKAEPVPARTELPVAPNSWLEHKLDATVPSSAHATKPIEPMPVPKKPKPEANKVKPVIKKPKPAPEPKPAKSKHVKESAKHTHKVEPVREAAPPTAEIELKPLKPRLETHVTRMEKPSQEEPQAPSAGKSNSGKPRRGLVPPPPPMIPVYPGMPPMGYSPAQQAPAPRPKPKEKPKETAKEPPASESKASSGSDEPDFILDWAGAKPKKKVH